MIIRVIDDFDKLQQKFLGVSADICYMACAHLASDHVPVFAILSEGFQESFMLFLGPTAYAPSLPTEAKA